MKRILVIADDFSGAAEIAGIAFRYGLPARIERTAPTHVNAGLTVIDTNTRHASPQVVADIITRSTQHVHPGDFDLIYKKTDSVLRGPLLAELEAMMRIFNCPAAMLVAQNPSRGRTVSKGLYHIGTTPLHLTAFAHDPHHPARTANVMDLLARSSTYPVRCVDPDDAVSPNCVTIGAAETMDSVRQWARRVGPGILPAGSADFFQSLLEARGHRPASRAQPAIHTGVRLFVCGSASANRDVLIARAHHDQIPLCGTATLPNETCADCAIRGIDSAGRAIVLIDQPVDLSPGVPERLERELSSIVASILKSRRIDTLLLEGGATASAVCRAMKWDHFEVDAELAPGVTVLRSNEAGATSIIVKPGSYAWPPCVFDATTRDLAK